jgi:hypothetical protein
MQSLNLSAWPLSLHPANLAIVFRIEMWWQSLVAVWWKSGENAIDSVLNSDKQGFSIFDPGKLTVGSSLGVLRLSNDNLSPGQLIVQTSTNSRKARILPWLTKGHFGHPVFRIQSLHFPMRLWLLSLLWPIRMLRKFSSRDRVHVLELDLAKSASLPLSISRKADYEHLKSQGIEWRTRDE